MTTNETIEIDYDSILTSEFGRIGLGHEYGTYGGFDSPPTLDYHYVYRVKKLLGLIPLKTVIGKIESEASNAGGLRKEHGLHFLSNLNYDGLKIIVKCTDEEKNIGAVSKILECRLHEKIKLDLEGRI